MSEKKVAIIGSGPAGLTAAIYTSRANINTTVFTGMQPGGQLTTTTEIENFPGFAEPITGPELMERMQKQAENFGAKVKMGEATALEIDDKGEKKFRIKTNMNEEGDFDAVIVASGASAKYIGIEGEENYIGKGYHSCATCDGFFYRGKTIAIVGGGDSAMEEANFLTKFAEKVYLIHRKDSFRASKIMLERAQKNPKIEFLTNKSITKLIGDERVNKIELTDSITNQKSEMDIDGVFVAIGHTPNTDFVKNILKTDENGYLTPEKRTFTEIEGVFVAGDVTDQIYRQAITAAAEGCRSAIDCERWLESQE